MCSKVVLRVALVSCVLLLTMTQAKPISTSFQTEEVQSFGEKILRRFRRDEAMFTKIQSEHLDKAMKRKVLASIFRDDQANSAFNRCINGYIDYHGYGKMAHAVQHCIMRLP